MWPYGHVNWLPPSTKTLLPRSTKLLPLNTAAAPSRSCKVNFRSIYSPRDSLLRFRSVNRPKQAALRHNSCIRAEATPTTLPPLSFGFRAATLALTANVQDLPLTVAFARLLGVALLYWISAWVVARTLKATAKWMRKRTDLAIRSKQHVSTVNASIQSVVCALYVPAGMYLPTLALLNNIKLCGVFLRMCLDALDNVGVPDPVAEVALDAVKGEVTKTFIEVVLLEIYAITQRITSFSGSIHQVAFVVFIVWFVQRWKEELVQVVVLRAKERSGMGEGSELAQMLLPLSGLTSWAISIGGLLMILNVVGINIQPLLAVGGLGGVVIGWSAQTIFANALSGIKLFLTQPFVVGERIRLVEAGVEVISGYVESITPMYTTLRSDNLCLVHVPNKEAANMMVVNESRIAETVIETEFCDPRQWSMKLVMDLKDISKLGVIIADINQFLARDESVNKDLPFGANAQGLEKDGVALRVLAHTTPAYANKFSLFQSRLTMDVAEIVQKHRANNAQLSS